MSRFISSKATKARSHMRKRVVQLIKNRVVKRRQEKGYRV